MEYVRPDYGKNHELFKRWVVETVRDARRYRRPEDIEEAIITLEKEIAFFEEAAPNAMFSAEKRILKKLREGSRFLKKGLERMF